MMINYSRARIIIIYYKYIIINNYKNVYFFQKNAFKVASIAEITPVLKKLTI